MRSRLVLLTVLITFFALADASAQLRFEVAFPSLTFTRPVDMQPARDGSNRLFVVEQEGTIRVFQNTPGVANASMFLDIRNRVSRAHNEEGLLGLAFPPNFADSGYFFVYYCAANPRRSVVSRFRVDPSDSNRADPASELILMEVKQPFGNHKAGQMNFGPDGYLYIAFGDGGDAGDPFENAQDVKTILGKIVRIDVNGREDGRNYSIPVDNPFRGNTTARGEIYAYGFRNPWRFSFDPQTNWLWVPDVGQDAVEEINVVKKGGNYGWNMMEGSGCFDPLMQCDSAARAMGLQMPIWDYTHREGNTVIGGFVYRGSAVPGLVGRYVYSDFNSGRIWALRYNQQDTTAVENEVIHMIEEDLIISSFAVDANNELYVLAFDGKIHRLAGTAPGRDTITEPLKVAFPNLTFNRPVDMQAANDGSNRLFVVEQPGMIRVFDRTQSASSAEVFLDIRGRVRTVNPEEGLLGLAFPPNYRDSGYFYVYYVASSPRRSIVSRFRRSTTNVNRADSTSEMILMQVEQPYGNHKAGQMRFGSDGYLYIAFGDGGDAGDPHRHAQDSGTVLGKIIRIDVNSTSGGRPYGIPSDNPLAGNTSGYSQEIYAMGFRNPWRFSFDSQTGWLWVGDAGQDKIEEINVVRKGGNYGWNYMEGSGCFFPKQRCDQMAREMGLAMPIWDYTHNLGSVVVGGFVYRGSAVQRLVGKYIFSDFASGRIWALDYNQQDTTAVKVYQIGTTDVGIAAYAVDQNNELYMLGLDGKIHTFQSTVVSTVREDDPDRGYTMLKSFPNPTSGTTLVTYDLLQRGRVELIIHDINGNQIRTLVNEPLGGGAYTITWDGVNDNGARVPSGSYLCRLSVDGKPVATEQIVLVR